MNNAPFGLLITWTCYGTWLPGDERGYVSRTLVSPGRYRARRNTPGTLYDVDEPLTRRRARGFQRGSTVTLTQREAESAAQSLIDAAENRGWRILRGAVMYHHVHAVLTNCPDDGPAVRRVLKGTSQAKLSRLADKPRRWWTQGGSNRYLRGEQAILGAVRYVAEQHGILAAIVDNQLIFTLTSQ